MAHRRSTHLLSLKSGNRRNSPFLLHRTTAAESTVEQWSAAAARSFLTTTSVGSTEKRKSGANDDGRGAKLMPERKTEEGEMRLLLGSQFQFAERL